MALGDFHEKFGAVHNLGEANEERHGMSQTQEANHVSHLAQWNGREGDLTWR